MPAASAPASRGAISSAQGRYVETLDARQAPIPLPTLKTGERCFRSTSRAFTISVRDDKDVVINDAHGQPRLIEGLKKIARFREHSGWYGGKVFLYGELVTSDADEIRVITEHPEFGRRIWDAVKEKDTFLNLRTKQLADEISGNPALRAALKGKVFDLSDDEPKPEPQDLPIVLAAIEAAGNPAIRALEATPEVPKRKGWPKGKPRKPKVEPEA